MFNVFINNGTQELPPDDILYIVAKDGTYLKKKLGIMESIAPVKNISILQGIETMAKMHITKISAPMMAKTIEFFREVNKEVHGSEAIIIDFYNIESRKHKLKAPFQQVSGASVKYTKPIPEEGWNMAGTIHSHNTMSAFHSAIDDSDEKYFDGLHITIGNVNEDYVSISASIVSNGTRFIVDPVEYIDGIKLVIDIDEDEEKPYSSVWRWDKDQKKMIEQSSKYTYKVHKFDKRYDISSTDHQKIFNKIWMKRVEYQQPTYNYNIHQSKYKTNPINWNQNFDPGVWEEVRETRKQKNKKSDVFPISSKETVASKEKFTGKIDVVEPDDLNPCLECAFKDHKIDLMLDQIEENEKDYDGDYWECMNCHVVFYTEEGKSSNAVCPECKDDNYLIEAYPEDLKKTTEDGNFNCISCGTEARIESLNDGECPFCGILIMPDQSTKTTELTNEQQYLLEVNDEELERIPFQESDAIPLNKKNNMNFSKRLLSKGKQ